MLCIVAIGYKHYTANEQTYTQGKTQVSKYSQEDGVDDDDTIGLSWFRETHGEGSTAGLYYWVREVGGNCVCVCVCV